MKVENLPKDQIDRVFNQDMCDIDNEFLGFMDIYESLAKIIPKHFTVVDLGCAYNPQCVLFKDHKKFVGVDVMENLERFTQDNCTIYEMTIENFISEHIDRFDLDETFAMCSYVPPWGGDNIKMVREAFKNVFTYYPHGGHNISFKKMKSKYESLTLG